MEVIDKLNKKYSQEKDIFYFFHRERVYSETQEKWMGWERKRGALIEFNKLLLGDRKQLLMLYPEIFPISKLNMLLHWMQTLSYPLMGQKD